jgi:peptide/nickel transport system substrate-binding protein
MRAESLRPTVTRDIDRRRFLTGAGAVASVAVAGCSGEDPVDGTDDPGTDESPDGTDDDMDGGDMDGGELQLTDETQSTLDPIGIGGPFNAWINWQLHEALFTFEDGTAPAVGLLAEDYSVSDDYLTYTFDLQQGVTFHDGSELTAEDVVFSWRRLVESENNRGNTDVVARGPMSIAHEYDEEDETIVPDTLAVDAVDEYTVEMTLESPFPNALGNLSDPRTSIVPEGIVGDIEGYDGEYDYDTWATEGLHGTGPFQLDTWSQGDEVVVSAFEDYHGSAPNIDGIRWQMLGDPNARFAAAVNEQNIDMFRLPRSRFDPSLLSVEEDLGGDRREGTYGPVANDTTLNYGETSLPRTQYLIFNTQRVDEPARKAIAHLVNQETVSQQATRGQGEPAYFLTPPSAFPGGPEEYEQLAEEEYPYGYGESQPDAARQVMEDAGYGPDDMYETSLQHPSDEQSSAWSAVASLLRDRAQSAHIDLEIETAPGSALFNRALDGDITIFATWNALGWLEADAMLRFAYPNQFAWSRWGAGVDFEYDQLSDAAQDATDAWERYQEHRTPAEGNQEIRNEAYLTIERANWEDMTMLPLWHPTEELYWYDWVENFEMHGSQRRPSLNEITLGERP